MPDEDWVLADAMPDRYRASVIVAFRSGLRAGELFALQRRHVDLKAGTLQVEQSPSVGYPEPGRQRFRRRATCC